MQVIQSCLILIFLLLCSKTRKKRLETLPGRVWIKRSDKAEKLRIDATLTRADPIGSARGSDGLTFYSSSITDRMLPAGSLNQAI